MTQCYRSATSCYPPAAMGKTLIIAEKPSVGQDYSKALGGSFQKHEGYLESGDQIVSWAIGHLVELAEPEDYDAALKRWSIKTLPVLPEQFKLRPESRGRKQFDVIKRLLKRDDVDEVINGCDAGREGELIFAYIYDQSKSKKPVQRLWVNSMTKSAIRDAFEHLRPGEEMANLEAAARSRSEADWLVGMNATRAATVRGRALGGVVSLGPGADAHAGADRQARSRDRRLRARDLLPDRRQVCALRRPRLSRTLVRGQGRPHPGARTRRRRRRCRHRASPPPSRRSSAPSARPVRRCCTT